MQSFIKTFEEKAKLYAGQTALVDAGGERRTSYAQLDDMRKKVASKIMKMNPGNGTPVIINMGRCREYIAAYLGIQTAGCAAVTVTTDYPDERVASIAKDCGAKLIIRDEFFSDIEGYEPAGTVDVSSETAAHITYTSGSTGKPKGIVHTVESLQSMIERTSGLYDIGQSVIIGAGSVFSFAIHIFEVLSPLALGAEIHIISDHVRKNPEELAQYYLNHKINMSFIAPQLFKNMEIKSPYYKRALSGGETVCNIFSKDYETVVVYGTSETGLVSSFLLDKSYARSPIGKPLPGCEFIILPSGEDIESDEGELCVKCVCAREYINLPDESSAVFEKLADGTTLYHTKDIVRRLEDGNNMYVNRADWMVKVNGQRVETLEVESVLKQIDGIQDAAVKAFTDNNDQTYLCAYYVADDIYSENALRKELLKKVPSYMEPRFFVKLKEIPLNANGKIDRASLMPPSIDDYKTGYTAPENETQKVICDAVKDVLDCGEVGIRDDFFALGGDSIKVIKLIAAIEKELDMTLSIDDVMTGRTCEKMAQLLKKTNKKENIKPDETAKYVPLTNAQRGIYFECMEDIESTMYNIPFALELPENTDIDKFEQAVIKAALAHEVLLSTVCMKSADAVMVRHEGEISVGHTYAENKEEAFKNFVKPFNLEKGPLYRFEICRTEDAALFLLDIHHIIFDGTSVKILLNSISEAYSGKEPAKEEESLFDAALEEEKLYLKEEYKEAQHFFENEFEHEQYSTDIISDVKFPDGKKTAGSLDIYARDLPVPEVEHFVKKAKITESTLFMAAFAYTLSVFTLSEECFFTTVSSGRHSSGLSNTIGMFVKTLPLHISVPQSGDTVEFLRFVEKKLYATLKNDCISFAELASGYGVNADVSFVYQSELLSEVEIGQNSVLPKQLPLNDCQAKILCMVLKGEKGYKIHTEYQKSTLTKEMAESISEMIFRVAEGIIDSDDLGEIKLTGEKDEELIKNINETARAYDESETVNSVFEQAAKRFKDRPALRFNGKNYTYEQFEAITRKIAAFINEKGISPNEFVAVLGPRNDLTVAAIWGIVRAGAAFQVLDITYPKDRINYMVKDSGARLLIADKSLAGLADTYDGDILYFEDFDALDEARSFKPCNNPHDALTLIYSSGTTGKPKGAILENANLVALYHGHKANVGTDENSRMATYASFGFDAGVMDIITTLMAGACLYIIPDEIRLDMAEVDAFLCENGITHANMTTQMARMLCIETKSKALKAVNFGGEKLVPFTPKEGFAAMNSYGPCETITYICSHKVSDNSVIQPIGKPNINTKLYIFDKLGRLLPTGAPGELGISGKQVGRGYLGLDDLTKSVFVDNPYCAEAGYERMYKTGDIVRLLPGGEFEFIGRRDGQVKVRGFRIELTEVEEVIRRFDGIKDATVVAFDDNAGGKYIAAYICADTEIDKENLCAFILKEKPSYMVPSVIMQIESIPYTQNHKVNKRALPAPKRAPGGETAEKCENEIQEKIHAIVSDVLGYDDFGINTNLFDAGLTSIGTIRLNMDLGKAFNTPVKISDIKENPNVKSLAKLLENAEGNTVYETRESYPLMQNQMGVFLDAGVDRKTLKYNVPLIMKVSEALDADKLTDAVKKAVNAHPYIKARLCTDAEGNVLASRHDDEEPAVEHIKCDHLPGMDALFAPFDIINEALYRIKLYDTGDGRYLVFDMHHIISDGTSLGILLDDINKAYEGFDVDKEEYTAFDMALDEQKEMQGATYERAEKYFENLLSLCSTESISAKCPERDAGEEECDEKKFTFGDISKEITEFCTLNNLSQNAFFNAVFSYTLSRFIHSDDVTYCTIYNGRNDSRLSRCFSMLVKTLPVRCEIDTKTNVVSYIKSVQTQLVDTMTNDIVPFSVLCSKYGIRPDVFFNYQSDSFNFDKIGGKESKIEDIGLLGAKAPLSIEVFLENGVYQAKMEYRKDIFCEEYVSSFSEALVCAARDFTREDMLKDVSVMPESELEHFNEMNSTEKDFERVPAHVIFERAAKENPDKVAVKTENASLTFRELNEKAEAIASALISLGARNGEIIALIAERSELVPAAEIGILKAGCAFLPMLPSYPDERLDYCIKDANCRFVISQKDIIASRKELFPEDGTVKALDIEKLISEGSGKNAPGIEIEQNQLAYCIYTSGSTGTPKGVMLEHHNLSNFVQTAALREIEKRGSTILAMASISFDMSITEIFFSLCMGNTVYIASEEEVHNLDKLLAAFTKNNIDMMMMTPSFAWSLLSMSEFEGALSNLKGIVLGAEAFQSALYEKLKKLNADMLVQNGYGPTECTQVCSVKTLTDGENITIGSPFANTKFYVADDDGNLLPRYAVGELIICGEGVCRGYVNLPEKNAETFTKIKGLRAYRSGDLVRVNRDNEVEFGGRNDNQVKLRGFRIELDEIENVMQEFDGISQSKVVVRNNGTEDYLAGFFTASDKIDTDALTAYLKSKLTYYMVPSALMQLDKMPMTPNGKLYKKALPDIKVERKTSSKKRAPKKSLEEKILDQFKSVLGIDECYVDDNFFEIGGTSLSASKVVMQLKSDGYKIEYQDIFDHQSAEELAVYLESLSDVKAKESVKTDTGDDFYINENDDIKETLKFNTMEYADKVERKSLGTLLLTGASGFLGIHILKTFLDTEDGNVICLMRKGQFQEAETRLQTSLVYYFEDDCAEQFKNRITVIDGDITDDGLLDMFKDIHFDTLINCAACVKHFANDNSIEYVNVHGVEKLIELTKAKDAKMIQISTTSVPGAHNEETYRVNLKMYENQLFVIDDMNNQYGQSKYHAELKMLAAIKEGMRGKIIRVGNLMGRYSDGEFQTNMRTNAFLNGLRGFANIGKCPLSHATDPMKFSPIDYTAKAVVLLSGTNDMFTAFHADSRASFDEMKVIEAVNRCGITVKPVSDEEYYEDFYRMMGDPKMNEKVSALLTNDRPDVHMVETDNRFSTNVLYRLGFSWPFINDEYLEKVVMSLDTMDFFFHD